MSHVQSAELNATRSTVAQCTVVCKVMDPEQARAEVRRKQREGSILVCFFGDNEYGWYTSDSLVPFWEHYDEKSSQKTAKGHKVRGRKAPSGVYHCSLVHCLQSSMEDLRCLSVLVCFTNAEVHKGSGGG